MSQSISLCYGKFSFLEGGWGWWLMISVIVPVYKVEPYLQQCVDSILNQTYRDLEVLLIDDGSPDRCGEICDEYERQDKRVRVFHTENRGLSAARNLGLREATGEYIGFVDSDDWIDPDMYDVLLKRLEETGADICVCGFWYEYASTIKECKLQEAVYSAETALRMLLHERISNHAWNKLYRKELFQNVVFPEDVYFEDIVIMHRIIKEVNNLTTISVMGYHYRQREGSISKSCGTKSLVDYADAHIRRYYFLKENNYSIFLDNQDTLLHFSAEAIFRVLKWWHGCCNDEKKLYSDKLKEFKDFAKVELPFLGERTWSTQLRVSTLVMRYPNEVSLYVIYKLNQLRSMTKYSGEKMIPT